MRDEATAAQVAPRSLIEIHLLPTPGEPGPQIDWSLPVFVSIQPAGGGPAYDADVIQQLIRFNVLAALPAELPLGPAELRLDFNGGERLTAAIEVVASDFALFTGDPDQFATLLPVLRTYGLDKAEQF